MTTEQKNELLTETILKFNARIIELENRVQVLELNLWELKTKSEKSKAFKKPTEEDVMNYAIGKGLDTYKAAELGIKFCSFYESKGWMIGKNKMKSWESAVATWLKSGQYNTVNNSETLKSKWL